MEPIFNAPVHVNTISALYAIQDDILVALTVIGLKIHIIDGSHVCGVDDRLGFLENRMMDYKCIIIPSTLREEALRFCTIIENQTGHEIHLFCPLCGHQNI